MYLTQPFYQNRKCLIRKRYCQKTEHISIEIFVWNEFWNLDVHKFTWLRLHQLNCLLNFNWTLYCLHFIFDIAMIDPKLLTNLFKRSLERSKFELKDKINTILLRLCSTHGKLKKDGRRFLSLYINMLKSLLIINDCQPKH